MEQSGTTAKQLDRWQKPRLEEVRRFNVSERKLEGGYFSVEGKTYVLPVIWNPKTGSYKTLTSFRALDPTVHSFWAQVDTFLRNQNVYLMLPGVANLPHAPL